MESEENLFQENTMSNELTLPENTNIIEDDFTNSNINQFRVSEISLNKFEIETEAQQFKI